MIDTVAVLQGRLEAVGAELARLASRHVRVDLRPQLLAGQGAVGAPVAQQAVLPLAAGATDRVGLATEVGDVGRIRVELVGALDALELAVVQDAEVLDAGQLLSLDLRHRLQVNLRFAPKKRAVNDGHLKTIDLGF